MNVRQSPEAPTIHPDGSVDGPLRAWIAEEA